VDEKTNQKREDKHFDERWYRDQVKNTIKNTKPSSIPYHIVNKGGPLQREAREKFYSEWRKSQRKKQLRMAAIIITVSISMAYVLTWLGVRINF
jgi:hypothetical protein